MLRALPEVQTDSPKLTREFYLISFIYATPQIIKQRIIQKIPHHCCFFFHLSILYFFCDYFDAPSVRPVSWPCAKISSFQRRWNGNRLQSKIAKQLVLLFPLVKTLCTLQFSFSCLVYLQFDSLSLRQSSNVFLGGFSVVNKSAELILEPHQDLLQLANLATVTCSHMHRLRSIGQQISRYDGNFGCVQRDNRNTRLGIAQEKLITTSITNGRVTLPG